MSKSTSNSKVHAKTINKKEMIGVEFSVEDEEIQKTDSGDEKDDDTATERRKHAAALRSRELNTVAEQIAEEKFHHINFMWPGGQKAFPFNSKMWTVSRYFPYAKGGPLFVDEPRRVDEVKELELKREAMKQLGNRYVVITEGMSYVDALEQMA